MASNIATTDLLIQRVVGKPIDQYVRDIVAEGGNHITFRDQLARQTGVTLDLRTAKTWMSFYIEDTE